MSNLGWAIATRVMLALGASFISNQSHRDQADGLTIISNEIDRPDGDPEKE